MEPSYYCCIHAWFVSLSCRLLATGTGAWRPSWSRCPPERVTGARGGWLWRRGRRGGRIAHTHALRDVNRRAVLFRPQNRRLRQGNADSMQPPAPSREVHKLAPRVGRRGRGRRLRRALATSWPTSQGRPHMADFPTPSPDVNLPTLGRPFDLKVGLSTSTSSSRHRASRLRAPR
jgi:hypothetical protein